MQSIAQSEAGATRKIPAVATSATSRTLANTYGQPLCKGVNKEASTFSSTAATVECNVPGVSAGCSKLAGAVRIEAKSLCPGSLYDTLRP